MAIAGTWQLASWIGGLVSGATVIGTDNFIVGLPLLGLSIFAIGPEFIAPRALALWSDERRARFGKAVLGTMLVGLALVFLGQVVINVVMAMDGYRACRVGGRGRVVDVTWARKDAACPPAEPGR